MPVLNRTISKVDGTSSVQAELRLHDAPVPERKYCADRVWVAETADALRLIFAQSDLVGAGIQSAVAVAIFQDHLRRFLESGGGLPAKIHAAGFTARLDTPPEKSPEQSVVLAASIIAATFSGAEACLDFYHVSPRALHAAGTGGGDLAVDPVVRIDLPTTLLAGLFARIQEIMSVEGQHG